MYSIILIAILLGIACVFYLCDHFFGRSDLWKFSSAWALFIAGGFTYITLVVTLCYGTIQCFDIYKINIAQTRLVQFEGDEKLHSAEYKNAARSDLSIDGLLSLAVPLALERKSIEKLKKRMESIHKRISLAQDSNFLLSFLIPDPDGAFDVSVKKLIAQQTPRR